jgi:hypothetical protein
MSHSRLIPPVLAVLGVWASCAKDSPVPDSAQPTAANTGTGAAKAPLPAALPAAERALTVVDGIERWTLTRVAIDQHHTIIDLSDDWTPFIFAPHRSADGTVLHNQYRRIFIGLANDKLDEEGRPLPKSAVNYLELYGIPPSLSRIRARFLEDAVRTCAPESALPQDEPSLKGEARIDAAAERLHCEGLLKHLRRRRPTKGDKTGELDTYLQHALRSFQQKHMIYEGHGLRPRTREALGRTLLENNHRALLRVLQERVVSATAIIEDESIESKPGGNLADEYTAEAARQLGLDTPEKALAFFQRHPEADFARLLAAVKLPPRPDYHGDNMDLSISIDRGDVWYELPFDKNGVYRPPMRKKFPYFSLWVQHGEKKILLARWRTTIGGWRTEQASDGYEYFRYKGSDVGPRVIRQVIAGPVWIAPTSTPIRGLTKLKQVNGHWQAMVNYDELGPGYLSAYGLIAGYVVSPGRDGRSDFDNGIRIHGSSEYLSMYSWRGFSHGCHRLPNHRAIRLYSFLLKHRPMSIVGDIPARLTRQFLKDDRVFEMRIPSRGFAYTLDPPVPVMVFEGNIKGKLKKPILDYVPQPGVQYPGPPPPAANSPEARAGAGGKKDSSEESEEQDKP